MPQDPDAITGSSLQLPSSLLNNNNHSITMTPPQLTAHRPEASLQRLLGEYDTRICGVCPLAFPGCRLNTTAVLMPSSADSPRISNHTSPHAKTLAPSRRKQLNTHASHIEGRPPAIRTRPLRAKHRPQINHPRSFSSTSASSSETSIRGSASASCSRSIGRK